MAQVQRARTHTLQASNKATSQNKMMSYNILSLTLILLFPHLLSSSQHITTASDCLKQRCGIASTLEVSYPFALDDLQYSGCAAFSDFFRIHCDAQKSKLFINISTSYVDFVGNFTVPVEVTHITNDSLVIDITDVRANVTYNMSCGLVNNSYNYPSINLPSFPSPFVVSYDNQFGIFGCRYYGIFDFGEVATENFTDRDYEIFDKKTGGCFTESCRDNGTTCGNHTCCLTNLTAQNGLGMRYVDYYVHKFRTPKIDDICSAADDRVGYGTFFHPTYTDFWKESYQLQLKWALPYNQTHDVNAIKQSSDYACSPNSSITFVDEVPGYLCSCNPGYEGDGYFNGTNCTDVNECELARDDCVSRSTCHNSAGNYTCKCNGHFYVGDGRLSGSGCQFSHRIKLAIGISSASVILLLIIGGSSYLAIWWRNRTKRKYFMQNGGLELQEFFGARPGRQMTRLFKSEELKAATDNYAEHMKIGIGGFGVVFKGVLNDGTLVAIKKAKNTGSKDGVDCRQFLNEMAILTQINHRHIVQLLGCCLETEAPLLVYEYVSNGNVAENLEAERVIMSWEQRLKVARQTAEALSYLHAAASPPILHRDVKSANVLLDDNLDAKVADFGLSRLVPDGVQHVSTIVQGTLGYVDPEYFQTLQLTDKSDVYSLGVMLTELVTGLKPVDTHNREPAFANLASLFIRQMQEDKLDELIDARLITKASGDLALHIYSSITDVAMIACQCLALEGSLRPSMSHVADQLRHISQSLQARGNENNEEATPLLSSKKEAVVARAGAIVKEFQYQRLDSGSTGSNTMLLSSTNLAR